MFRIALMVALLGLVACERNKPLTPGEQVRARVNGVAITGHEVDARLFGAAGGAQPTPAQRQHALDELIDDELQAQAFEPGSIDDAGVDSKARDARRHALARQFRMKLLEEATATPEELHAWFDANTARVQSQFQLQVIKVQGREKGEAVLAELAAGRSFDDVADAQFPKAPEPKPWAVQAMAWAQVPPPWWSELDSLAPGKTSGLIADQGDRYWVVKVIARKQNPAMTFDAAAAAIDATLRARKFEERREAAMKALRAKAKLEVSSGSAAEAAR